MEPIEFGPEILSSMDASLEREWLETNGIGGFASSTIVGVNTRRYHGLLVAAIKPPVERLVLLSKVEETVVMNGKHHDLGSNRYPGVIYPRGFEMLTRFALDPFPKFTFRIGDIEIEKRVFLVHGENTVVIEYETRGGGSCTLAIRPLIAFRDYHSLTHRNSALNTEIVTLEGCVQITPYAGLPTLCTSHNGVAVESTGDWYYNFEYDRELERGLNFQEDLFNPFQVRYEIRSGEIARLVASTRPIDVSEVPAMREREIARRRVVVAESPSTDEFIRETHLRRGPVHRETGWLEDDHCGLPLVQRLGTRHDDLLARINAGYGSLRCCPEYPAGVCREDRSGHAAKSLPRCRRDA